MRYVTNSYIARCFNSAVKRIKDNPHRQFYVLDFGAKATKNAKLLLRALGHRTNWSYHPERNDIQPYDKQWWIENGSAYSALLANNPDRLRPIKKRYVDENWTFDCPADVEMLVFSFDCLSYYV